MSTSNRPTTPHISSPIPNGKPLMPNNIRDRPEQLPNTPFIISLISTILGGIIFSSFSFALVPYIQKSGADKWNCATPQLAVYLVALSLFHLLEFWVTAEYNSGKLSVDSFLLTNGSAYWIAHFTGLTEYLITSYFYPQKAQTFWNDYRYILPVLAVLILSQLLRSLAMIHASSSFSHLVKAVKLNDHVLVTHGVYGYFRHPSYVGFFYWAIATQMLLGNPASTLLFIMILGRFFYKRIKEEERFLVRFFGNDYVEYRKRVRTGLPFPIPTQ